MLQEARRGPNEGGTEKCRGKGDFLVQGYWVYQEVGNFRTGGGAIMEPKKKTRARGDPIPPKGVTGESQEKDQPGEAVQWSQKRRKLSVAGVAPIFQGHH